MNEMELNNVNGGLLLPVPTPEEAAQLAIDGGEKVVHDIVRFVHWLLN